MTGAAPAVLFRKTQALSRPDGRAYYLSVFRAAEFVNNTDHGFFFFFFD